ncbi:MAG: hypothetical protein ACYC56_04260 [Candidatus Aquicultor sp.]
MRYFKVKKVVVPPPEDTTLNIVTGLEEKATMFSEVDGYQYYGVETTDENFLAKQHAACGVEELTFTQVEPVLKECALYKSINEIVQTKIRSKYSAGDEIKLNRMSNAVAKTQTPQEFWDYNTYVDECCAYGDQLKIDAGLKQA